MIFEGMIGVVTGIILLFWGRRMFWLAAGLLAFLFGWQFLQNFFGDGSFPILAGIVLGILFAWLAVRFIKTIAFIVAFLAGALALPYFLGIFGVDFSWVWIALIGGLLGLVVIATAFNWGVVLLTAWVGASSISGGLKGSLDLSEAVAGLIFISLLLLGIVYQVSHQRRRKR
jgi:hypothetical protein